jgi:hypothetical protein
MVHVGFEPSAVLGANSKLGDNWKLLSWQLSGKMGGAGKRAGAGSNGGNGHSGGSGNGRTNPWQPGEAPRPGDLVAPDGSLRVL